MLGKDTPKNGGNLDKRKTVPTNQFRFQFLYSDYTKHPTADTENDNDVATMVVFSCDGCGEVLKKNQVDAHAARCRSCASVSCADCAVSFYGGTCVFVCVSCHVELRCTWHGMDCLTWLICLIVQWLLLLLFLYLVPMGFFESRSNKIWTNIIYDTHRHIHILTITTSKFFVELVWQEDWHPNDGRTPPPPNDYNYCFKLDGLNIPGRFMILIKLWWIGNTRKMTPMQWKNNYHTSIHILYQPIPFFLLFLPISSFILVWWSDGLMVMKKIHRWLSNPYDMYYRSRTVWKKCVSTE